MRIIGKLKFLDSSRIVIFSFLFMILIGTLLLMLPWSTQNQQLALIDALFTATSATCVTGLTVVDIGTSCSLFGQIVILLLIQAGGLGIMTFSTFFIFLMMGKFSISGREVIQETMTQQPFRNIAGLLKTIFIATILIELAGTLLLTFCFWDQFSPLRSFYCGIFHAISAFCNAGFSLFPNSFIDYQGDWKINLIIIALIICGGLGFIVLNDVKRYFFIRSRKIKSAFSFHSKLALAITLVLIIAGTLILFLFELQNILYQQPLLIKFLVPFFQSVTSRTAGFNTIDIAKLTDASLFFIIVLMFIGASPGSCGGGVKTTTAGVVFAMLLAKSKNQEDVNIGRHRVPNEIVSKAVSVTFFAMMIVILATILLMLIEEWGISHIYSRGLFLESFFEVISAFGTVGLSTGITPELSALGKLILVIVMFIGRVGPLTVVLAVGRKMPPRFKYAQENILIG